MSKCVCCYHRCVGATYVVFVVLATALSWIAAFDCDFVRLTEGDDDRNSEAATILFDTMPEGASSDIHAGIWTVQQNLFADPSFSPNRRCNTWSSASLQTPEGALSILGLDLTHKVVQILGMIVFGASNLLLFMGLLMSCCVMNKTITNCMAGLSFIASILTALFTLMLASDLCRRLTCRFGIDFYCALAGAVCWFGAGAVLAFGMPKQRKKRNKRSSNSSANDSAVESLEPAEFNSDGKTLDKPIVPSPVDLESSFDVDYGCSIEQT